MSFVLRLIPAAAAACVLASCGGGNAGAPPTAGGGNPPPVVASSGHAVDGALSGATVVCDSNGNGVADSGETSVVTDASGLFSFASGCASALAATGGTSADTGLPFNGLLRAPAGATVVSPLTTLLALGMSQSQVNASLGLPASTALTTTNPAALSGGVLANADLAARTLALQQLLQKLTELFAGLGGDTAAATQQAVYGEVSAAVSTLLAGGGTLFSGSSVDAGVVGSLVKAAAQRVAASAGVGSGVKNAVAALNADALAQVVAGGLQIEAQALLGASAATLVAVTQTQQADTQITGFVQANAAALGAPPGTATATLASTLTAQIAASNAAPLAVGPHGELVTFEETPPPVLAGFGGAEDATIVTDPVTGSGHVAKIVKAAGSEVWAGTTISLGPNATIATVPFTATATTLTARVWSPDAGIPVRLKLEDATDPTKSVETDATVTTAGAWQTLQWDFSHVAAGTSALNLATTYDKASVFFDFGSVGTGKTYYVDDLSFSAAAAAPTNYLALAGDALRLVNGSTSTTYTMAAFQSAAGISVSWPLPEPMTLEVALSEVGTASIPANQTVSAAVSITETSPGGHGEVDAYIDGIVVTKTATGLQVSIPAGAGSLLYGVSSDGQKKAVIDFGSSVAGIANTLSTAAGSSNSILLGNVVNYAINQVSNDFTGIYGLRGSYRVTVVLDGLPLRKADGSALPQTTVVVPTALDGSGAVTASKTVTGAGLTGTITLTN